MRLNKRKKLKNAEKRVIKRRLIEISILVDAYIYKNKPITVEDAQKYVQEITVHQTKCNNDKHVLQVIEKLTRCMKTIIEDTKTVSSHQNAALPENIQNVDLLPLAPSPNNKLEEKNEIVGNCDVECTFEGFSKSKSQAHNIPDIIVISDNENEKNIDTNDEELPVYNKDKEGSVNLSNKEQNNELIITEINSMDNNKSQLALPRNITNLKPHSRKISQKPKQILKDNYNSIPKNSEIKRKCKKKVTKIQKPIPPTSHISTTTFESLNISGITHKLSQCNETLNLETEVHKNKPKLDPKKTQKRASKKNANNDFPDATKNETKRKKSRKENKTETINCKAPPNKCNFVDIMSNEVPIPMQRGNNSEVINIVTNRDSVTNQLGTHRNNNDQVSNDLSWVEGIRYVREIGTDEFDQTPNRFKEAFWDNFLLPDGWKDVDFL